MIRSLRLFAAVSVGVVGSLVLACIGAEREAVHFNGYGIDFGAPPARYAMYPGELLGTGPAWRAGTRYWDDERPDSEGVEEHEENRMHRLFREAALAEGYAEYRKALSLWNRCQKYGVGSLGTVRRRIDLLRVVVGHPHLHLIPELLLSSRPYLAKGQIPDPTKLDRLIRPFALYERAIRLRDVHQAVVAYREIATQFPESPLAEPALIMIPRMLLSDNAKPNAADFGIARSALGKLTRDYPNSRFNLDVIGWRARMLYLRGQLHPALFEYRRQFALSPSAVGAAKPLGSIILCETGLHRRAGVAAAYVLRYGLTDDRLLRYGAITRLKACFNSFSAADGNAFWKLLRIDPRLMAFYMDFRLDNTSSPTGLLELAERNDSAVLRSPYKARFLSRASEAAYRLGRKRLAARYARWTLRCRPSNDDAARAEFVLGSVNRRIAKTNEAIRHFETIVHRYGDSYLRNGARENLALLYEHQGRFGDALDTYRQLNYKYDVAYLLDIRMKPGEIVSYLVSHPRLADRDGVEYSLGLRYLRKHNWTKAEQAFQTISRSKRASFRKRDDSYQFDQLPQQDPLTSAMDLAKLDDRVRSAPTGKARAAAMFAMADYYYSHRNLMLYNGFLWDGQRADLFGFDWNSRIATSQDDDAVWTHHWEHECMAQSLLICRNIVADYPRAPIRFQSAYMGACAAKRLSNFNPYWRWQSGYTNLDHEAARLMKIASRAPNKKLAAKARKYAAVFAVDADKSGAFNERRRSHRYRTDFGEEDGEG